MRVLCLLLLAATASAQVATNHLILPSYGGGHVDVCPTTVNGLYCWRIPARMGITNATKLAYSINNAGSAGCISSVGIYADSDAGALLGSAQNTCTAAAIKTASGLTPFSLVQGTLYRFCLCTTKTNCTYLALSQSEAATQNKEAILNANPADKRAAIATNVCTAGVLPATTGALATVTSIAPPLLLLEN